MVSGPPSDPSATAVTMAVAVESVSVEDPPAAKKDAEIDANQERVKDSLDDLLLYARALHASNRHSEALDVMKLLWPLIDEGDPQYALHLLTMASLHISLLQFDEAVAALQRAVSTRSLALLNRNDLLLLIARTCELQEVLGGPRKSSPTSAPTVRDRYIQVTNP